MRFADVRKSDGMISNVVEATPEWVAAQETDERHFVADPDGEADIGGTWTAEGGFTKPA